jgi:hypothetical protein
MGAWGTGVLSDDTVRDVYGIYLDLFNRGNSPDAIRQQLLADHEESLRDADEGPLIWIGIAKAQWDCAQLEPAILAKVREIVNGGLGLDRWAEQGERLLQARKAALRQFLIQLETDNPRPRKPRKAIKRKPLFQPGDCVAVRQPDGDWGAVLVLHREPESQDPFTETYGINLAAMLRYKNREMPTLEVFEKRDWLRLTHHAHKDRLHIFNAFGVRVRAVKDRLVRVGSITLQAKDLLRSESYSSWAGSLDQMYLQDLWDRGIRD